MAEILNTTLESASFSNVFDVINNRANIPDPRGGLTRVFVYDSDPLAKAIDFNDFPYIILELPTLEYSRVSVDGKHKEVGWKHILTVRSVKRGDSGWAVDSGRTDILAIGDDLQFTFNSSTIKTQLAGVNIQNVKLVKTETDTLPIDQRVVYSAAYTLEYHRRFTVST